MKYTTQYRGINAPQINIIFKNFWSENSKKLEDLTQKKLLAETMIKSSFGEDKIIGMMIFNKIFKEIDENYMKTNVKGFFLDKHIQDWAMCDGLCSKLLKPWTLLSKEKTLIISEWCNEENIWLKRASCVSFVTRAKHGDSEPNFVGFIDILFEICDKVVKCEERFAQLGCGWLLREISLVEKEKTIEFLKERLNEISSEGLRYAIEKMSNLEAKKMLELKKISRMSIKKSNK